MDNLELLVLLQLGAVLYLIYRVNRLEKRLDRGAPPVRRVARQQGDGKVIPLLKGGLAPGPFAGKSKTPPEPGERD